MSSNKSLFGAVLWKIGERMIVQIISLVTQIILARMIAPDKFGSLAIILVFYNLMDIIVQKGFGSALVRKKNLSQGNINAVFCISSLMAIIIYAILFLAAPYIGLFYKDADIVNPLRVLMINIMFSPLYCICNSILIRNMEFKTIFIRGLAASLISGGTGIILAFRGFGLWALVVQVVMNQLVLTLVMCVGLKPKLGLRFTREEFNEVFSFGKNVLITEILLNIVENVRTLLIGRVYTKSDLAYYDRGQVYPATLMRVIYDTIYSTLLPYFSKITDNRKRFAETYVTITHIAVLIIVPVFVGMAAVSPEIINILLTEKWREAIPYMQIFCIYQAIFPYQITSKIVLYAKGYSKKVLNIEILKSFISLILMIISMYFGVIYVALSLIAVRIISNTLYVLQVKKELGTTHIIKRTIQPIIASGIMFLVVWKINFIGLAPIVLLGIKIFVGVAVYCLIIAVTDKMAVEVVIRKIRELWRI